MRNEQLKRYSVINVAEVHAEKVWNPLLSQRLVDCFYRNFGKFVCASTVLGMGGIGFMTFRAMGGFDNNSFLTLAKDIVVMGAALSGGALAGFTGAYMASLGVAMLEESLGNLELNIRGRFSKIDKVN